MRKSMTMCSTSPPIQVPVDDATSVHLKSRKTSPTRATRVKTYTANLRPTTTAKPRIPWIPTGKAPTRDAAFQREWPRHYLGIRPPFLQQPSEQSQSGQRLAAVMTEEEEEEGLYGLISHYERKIESLMTEVSALKNEAELHKKEQLREGQSEQLRVSQCVSPVQEDELAEVTKELAYMERENSPSRHSMKKMLEETDDSRQPDKDALLRKLKEAELDGAAAARQVSTLQEWVSKLSVAKLSSSDSSVLAQQKGLLLQKLITFETTNRALRNLLREQQDYQMEMIQHSEQKDTLLRRLAKIEDENAHLVVKLQERDGKVVQLTNLLRTKKKNSKSTITIPKNLESTQARLQGQLRSIEAENNRLMVQTKSLKRVSTQQKEKLELLTSKLKKQTLKSAASQSALQKVRGSIKYYESLLDGYRIQVRKTRAEADDYNTLLAQAEEEVAVVRGQMRHEMASVRLKLLSRLAELETLPEALRRSQLQLQEAQEMERIQERRSMELNTTLMDLQMKVETQGSQMDLIRQKNEVLLEENILLQQKVELLEMEQKEASNHNRDLLAARDHAVTMECSSQAKILLDLETQLSRTMLEVNQLRCSSEEMEQRYQNRLQDMKDRLEHSDSTNRSLQNYIQFLKASFSNVFEE